MGSISVDLANLNGKYLGKKKPASILNMYKLFFPVIIL